MNSKPRDLLRHHFHRSKPASERTIKAEEIEKIARKGGSIDLRYAIIEGALDLCNASFTGSLLFISCVFGKRAHLSGSTFTSRVVLSGSSFRNGASFRGSVFKSDLRLKNARFQTSLAQFSDVVVEGLFWANRVIFGVRADFLGTRFQKAAFFRGATFVSEAVFEFAKFADYLDFSSATCRENAKFSNVQIGLANFKGAIFEKEVTFRAARIADDLWLSPVVNDKPNDAQFHGKAIFLGIVVGGNADFRGVKFYGEEISFNGAHFKGVAFFRSDVVEKEDGTPGKTLSLTIFAGKCDFTACRFGQSADFRGVICKKAVCFNSIHIAGIALFRSDLREPGAQLCRTVFEDEADFTAAYFGGGGEFQGVRFCGKATFLATTFVGACVCESYLLRRDHQPRLVTVFRKEVTFNFAHFQNDASFAAALFCDSTSFRSALFEKDATFFAAKFRKDVSFLGIRVEGQAVFCSEPSAKLVIRFRGPANFAQCDLGQAEFQGAKFQHAVSFKDGHIRGKADFGPAASGRVSLTGFKFFADFSGIEIGEATDFTQAIFHGEVWFSGAKFGGKFSFVRVRFEPDKERKEPSSPPPRVAFVACHFARKSDFSATVFQTTTPQRVCAAFDYSSFKEVADFGSSIFNNRVTFRGASFEGLEFSRVGTVSSPAAVGRESQFKEKIDLRGCTYEHIETSWKALICDGDDSRMIEFDHQPYLQMEKTQREAGNDRAADAVYLEHRKRYRYNKWHDDRLAWFGDAVFFWRLSNYGVRPWRLVVVAFLLLFFGVLFFSRLGAVELKNDEKPKSQVAATPSPSPSPVLSGKESKDTLASDKAPTNTSKQIHLDWKKATSVTLHQFIPIDIPLGAKWVPARRTEMYATVLRIAGAILVPLGIAIITGLVRRITR
jgi:uncharacterized protein YjbI with pentapeptide repeats